VTSAEKVASSLHVPGGVDAEAIDLPALHARGATAGPHVVILGGVPGDGACLVAQQEDCTP
jgi:hypothetical protein